VMPATNSVSLVLSNLIICLDMMKHSQTWGERVRSQGRVEGDADFQL